MAVVVYIEKRRSYCKYQIWTSKIERIPYCFPLDPLSKTLEPIPYPLVKKNIAVPLPPKGKGVGPNRNKYFYPRAPKEP